MKMRLVKAQWACLLFGIFALCPARAFATSTGRSDFFRTPASAFASGSELNAHLRLQTEHEISIDWIKVFNFQNSAQSKNKIENTGWLMRREVICASDLALEVITQNMTAIRQAPDWVSPPVQSLDPQTSVTVLESQSPWLKISTRNGYGFIPEANTQIRSEHWGAAIARKTTALRPLPNSNAHETVRLPAGEKVRITGITGEWLQVQLVKGHALLSGYVASRDVLTRLEFAKSVRLKNETGDLPIVRVLPGRVILHDGRVKLWTQITNFQSDNSLCLARQSQTSLRAEPSERAAILARIPAQAPMKNLGEVDIRWAQSQLPKHGAVWWKTNPLAKVQNEITTEQLFRRKVSRFLRYEYPDGPLYLVSAGGLFRSGDGHLWQSIAGFADQNYPLAMTKGGWIIAGSFVSTDRAQSFEPFIKWERVLGLVAHLGWPSPKRVGIVNVSANEKKSSGLTREPGSSDATSVSIGLDLGKKRQLTIATDDWGQNWRIAAATALKDGFSA